MIIELPKRLSYAGGDIKIPSDDPFITLTCIKNGAMLYSDQGKLLGQIFLDKKGAAVTIADAGNFKLSFFNGVLDVKSSVGNSATYYEIFGSVGRYQYTLFEYKKGTARPTEVACVTTTPLETAYYKVSLSEKCNIFRALMLVVAVSMLVQGENIKRK